MGAYYSRESFEELEELTLKNTDIKNNKFFLNILNILSYSLIFLFLINLIVLIYFLISILVIPTFNNNKY